MSAVHDEVRGKDVYADRLHVGGVLFTADNLLQRSSAPTAAPLAVLPTSASALEQIAEQAIARERAERKSEYEDLLKAMEASIESAPSVQRFRFERVAFKRKQHWIACGRRITAAELTERDGKRYLIHELTIAQMVQLLAAELDAIHAAAAPTE